MYQRTSSDNINMHTSDIGRDQHRILRGNKLWYKKNFVNFRKISSRHNSIGQLELLVYVIMLCATAADGTK